MKKIFITIPWFLPAYKAGGPIQSVANMVSELGRRDPIAIGSGDGSPESAAGNGPFYFKIFCGNKDLDGSVLNNVEFDKWIRYADNTEVWYTSKNNLSAVLQQEIKKDSPAYLFIMGIYSWPFNFKPLLFSKGVKKIISARGMLHPEALAQKNFKKKIYLSLWKILGLHQKNIFHATDEKEKEYIQQVFGSKTSVMVAANFPRVLEQQPVAKKNAGVLKLVSIALVSPMKNILWVLEVLGSGEWGVAGGEGEERSIEYNIYGPVKDKNYWEQCEELIKNLPGNIRVNYHGDISPAKIPEALAQNHVFILPSKSENFGHAIYEALTVGRPVITSNNTPWNNLKKFRAGINVSTGNIAELQNAIAYFVAMDQLQLKEWSNGAREYAMQAVDLDKTRQQYLEMFH
ncbi:MAG TPA: glycosyltransferase [Chitinophagaceae bacterium]|nr:glycosyltransferase [Chitinophagaceae bacterium]